VTGPGRHFSPDRLDKLSLHDDRALALDHHVERALHDDRALVGFASISSVAPKTILLLRTGT
jgi:hypothetical protein